MSPLDRADHRLTRLVFGARRRLSRVRSARIRTGRFEIPMLEGGRDHPGGPVVLLHGFSDTKDSFVDVARTLTRRRRVILPDLPGFAEASQPLDHRYTITTIGDVLARALREHCPEGVHMVGNSLGGAVAAWITLENPAWVRSLTLIGTAGVRMPVPSALQRHLQAGHNPFLLRDEHEYRAFLRFVLERRPPLPGSLVRVMARQFVGRRAMNAKIMTEVNQERLDLTERLAEIAVPTLVLWGDRDRLMDLSIARVLHRRIPRSRLVVLHGIGHCPQVEAPGATARRILETVAAADP